MYLERLAQCPEAGEWQEMADVAALDTPKGLASPPASLHFWVEETERSAHWRQCPGTLAGLADRSLEGTEERWAPCVAVYTALPHRGPALKIPGPLASGRSSQRLLCKNDSPQIRLRPESATLTPKFWGV